MPVGACERAFLAAAEQDGILLSRYKTAAINRRGHFGLPAEAASLFETLDAIFSSLGGRPDEQAAKTLTPLPGDFIHPRTFTVIEVDEFQHFTSYRRLTFESYASDAPLNYDLAHYVDLCEVWAPRADTYRRTKDAVGFGPSGRQRQRAYNDALRDLLLPLVGYRPIIRVAAPHGDGVLAYMENRDRIRSAIGVE